MPRPSSEKNPFITNPDAKNVNPQRFHQDENYASTKHFSEEKSERPHSDYAGGYMEWDENSHEEAEANVRSDQQIENAVKGALSLEPKVDRAQVDVQVIKGVVLLTGNVGDESVRLATEKRLHLIPGIREIKNRLTLHPR